MEEKTTPFTASLSSAGLEGFMVVARIIKGEETTRLDVFIGCNGAIVAIVSVSVLAMNFDSLSN